MTGERQTWVGAGGRVAAAGQHGQHVDEATWSKRRFSIEIVLRHVPAESRQLILDVLSSHFVYSVKFRKTFIAETYKVNSHKIQRNPIKQNEPNAKYTNTMNINAKGDN